MAQPLERSQLIISGSGLLSKSDMTFRLKSLLDDSDCLYCLEPLKLFEKRFGEYAGKCKSFDFVFDDFGNDRSRGLHIIAEKIIEECSLHKFSGLILGGHPTLSVKPVQHLLKLCPEWLEIIINPGISSVDWALADLGIDATENGLQIIGGHLASKLSPSFPVVVVSPGYAQSVKHEDRLRALVKLSREVIECYGENAEFIMYSRFDDGYAAEHIFACDFVELSNSPILGDKLLIGPLKILGV